MTLRISTGLRNHLLSGGSFKQAFDNGRIEIYSGSQPTTAEAAVQGTLLVTITRASGAYTAETPAAGSVTLDSGASGSVDTLTINSISVLDTAVAFDTSLAVTATNVAAMINKNTNNMEYMAESVGALIVLIAKQNYGTRFNTFVVASGATTIATTDVDFSGGVAAVNGLRFEDAGSGILTKRSGETWTGTAVATGTAGWFRLYGPWTDAGAAAGTDTVYRLDGAIATSGQQLNMSPTSITSGATQTIGTFSPTVPATL